MLVQPAAGPQASQALELLLAGLFHVGWLAPVYVVTLMINCSWYNEMAAAAMRVMQTHPALAAQQQQGGGGAHEAPAAGAPAPGAHLVSSASLQAALG